VAYDRGLTFERSRFKLVGKLSLGINPDEQPHWG
jgi:hypothetical protein